MPVGTFRVQRVAASVRCVRAVRSCRARVWCVRVAGRWGGVPSGGVRRPRRVQIIVRRRSRMCVARCDALSETYCAMRCVGIYSCQAPIACARGYGVDRSRKEFLTIASLAAASQSHPDRPRAPELSRGCLASPSSAAFSFRSTLRIPRHRRMPLHAGVACQPPSTLRGRAEFQSPALARTSRIRVQSAAPIRCEPPHAATSSRCRGDTRDAAYRTCNRRSSGDSNASVRCRFAVPSLLCSHRVGLARGTRLPSSFVRRSTSTR